MSLAADVRAGFDADGGEPFEVNVEFAVESGETLVLLGPSGSGKTLVLETVAGFHDHDGTVRLDGADATADPPERRGLGVVFQDYALFPHLTVRENVAFGARYHDDPRDPDDLLAALGVADLADRYPPGLSGGEAQRVALARALAIRPRAFLLDEPLSALDAPTRAALRADLADLLADRTAVYVTHDRTTARALADRVAVLRAGEIVQVGSVEAVFERPATPFVARFTGANCVPVEPADAAGPAGGAGTAGLALPDGTVLDGFEAAGDSAGPATADGGAGGDGPPTHLAIRPEYVELGDPGDVAASAGHAPLVCPVRRVVREDASYRVTVDLGGEPVDALVAESPEPGDSVSVRLPVERLTAVWDGV